MSHVETPLAPVLRVRAVVARHLPDWQLERPIPDDEALSSLGLSSIESISVLLELEDCFGVTFPDEMLTPENFRTVSTIVKTVVELLPELKESKPR